MVKARATQRKAIRRKAKERIKIIRPPQLSFTEKPTNPRGENVLIMGTEVNLIEGIKEVYSTNDEKEIGNN